MAVFAVFLGVDFVKSSKVLTGRKGQGLPGLADQTSNVRQLKCCGGKIMIGTISPALPQSIAIPTKCFDITVSCGCIRGFMRAPGGTIPPTPIKLGINGTAAPAQRARPIPLISSRRFITIPFSQFARLHNFADHEAEDDSEKEPDASANNISFVKFCHWQPFHDQWYFHKAFAYSKCELQLLRSLPEAKAKKRNRQLRIQHIDWRSKRAKLYQSSAAK